MDDLGKIIALVISLLTIQRLWLANRKAELENEILRQKLIRMRRGG